MSHFVPWPEEQIRFEREFKPALAKLLRQHFPHWKLAQIQLHEQRDRPDGLSAELRFTMTVVDGIARMELEEKA